MLALLRLLLVLSADTEKLCIKLFEATYRLRMQLWTSGFPFNPNAIPNPYRCGAMYMACSGDTTLTVQSTAYDLACIDKDFI